MKITRDPGLIVLLFTTTFVGIVVVIFGAVVAMGGGNPQRITGGIIIGIGVVDLIVGALALKYWDRLRPARDSVQHQDPPV